MVCLVSAHPHDVCMVEDYLFKAGTAQRFVNVSTLPIANGGMFIRTFYTHTAGLRTLLDPIHECLAAVIRGEIRTYANVISRSTAPKP